MGEAIVLNRSLIVFWGDHPAGACLGIAPPATWHLEYRSSDAWLPVANASGYAGAVNSLVEVNFDPVTTQCLRTVFDASGDGKQYAGVAVQEWEALAPKVVTVDALEKLMPSATASSACTAAPSSQSLGALKQFE